MSTTYKILMAAAVVFAALATLCLVVGQFNEAGIFALCTAFLFMAAVTERTRGPGNKEQ